MSSGTPMKASLKMFRGDHPSLSSPEFSTETTLCQRNRACFFGSLERGAYWDQNEKVLVFFEKKAGNVDFI